MKSDFLAHRDRIYSADTIVKANKDRFYSDEDLEQMDYFIVEDLNFATSLRCGRPYRDSGGYHFKNILDDMLDTKCPKH